MINHLRRNSLNTYSYSIPSYLAIGIIPIGVPIGIGRIGVITPRVNLYIRQLLNSLWELSPYFQEDADTQRPLNAMLNVLCHSSNMFKSLMDNIGKAIVKKLTKFLKE